MRKWRILVPVLAVTALVLGTFFPVHLQTDGGPPRVIIGNYASAQEADYLCDGENDHVQLQLALNELPSTGGMIYVLAGNYTFGNGQTVTRSIADVSIVGIGGASRFGGDGSTPLFEAGGDRWTFMNLMADCGGLNMAGTDDWCLVNVWNCTDHFTILSSEAGAEFTVHGNEMHDPDFATDADLTTLEGTVSTLSADLATLSDDLDDAELDILVLQVDVANLETWLSGNVSRIDEFEVWLSGNVSRIDEFEVWLSGNATRIDNLESWLSGNATRIDDLESWLSGNATRIDDLESWLAGNVTYLQGQITSNDGDITDLNSWLSGNVSYLQGQITSNDGDITDLNSWLSGNVSYLQGQITSNDGDITVLQGNVTDLAGNMTNLKTVGIVYIIDGGGEAISTGVAGFLEIPFDCTVTAWSIVADQSGSIVVDVWNDVYANFPPTVADTIAGSEKPTLSAAQKNQDTNLTTWTAGVDAGDFLAFNVDSASTVERVTVTLTAVRVTE